MRKRLLVGNPIGHVDGRPLEVLGDTALADAFGDRGSLGFELAGGKIGVERRSGRVGERNGDALALGLQAARNAAERAARADSGDEAVDLALGVDPDLFGRGRCVDVAVGGVVELVRPHGAARLGRRQGFGEAGGILHVVVGVAVRHGRHLDHLGAEHAQGVLLLLRLGVGNDDHRAQAERVAEHGEADAGVAGGALDNGATRPQAPAVHRLGDNAERGAVFHGGAGIHELGLAEDRAARFLGGAAKLDERRAADGGGDARARRDQGGDSIQERRTLAAPIVARNWPRRRIFRPNGRPFAAANLGRPPGRGRGALLFAVPARYIFARSFPTAAGTRRMAMWTGASRPSRRGRRAGVAKLADALGLGPSAARRGGSSPSARTTR